MMKAQIKIMRSYDYNHFEVSLSSHEEMTIEQVDDMRKEAARLVDKAVSQYQISKKVESAKIRASRMDKSYREDLQRRYDDVMKIPKSERQEGDKAIIKSYEDHLFLLEHDWDYQDWWFDRFDEDFGP